MKHLVAVASAFTLTCVLLGLHTPVVTETIYEFKGGNSGGGSEAALLVGADGALYGTTAIVGRGMLHPGRKDGQRP